MFKYYEKKLIALVEIFTTVIILPGGQYAQKGVGLDLPSNVQKITSQLPQSEQYKCLLSEIYAQCLHN